jgi:hypothetical protein
MTDKRARGDPSDDQTVEPQAGWGGDGPFFDAVFGALADWRRREVVDYFRDTGATTATVDELAFLIAAYEPDGTGGASRPHEELVGELAEDHLPRLARANVVEYDSRSGTVRYRGQPTVEKWLEHVRAVSEHETGDAN